MQVGMSGNRLRFRLWQGSRSLGIVWSCNWRFLQESVAKRIFQVGHEFAQHTAVGNWRLVGLRLGELWPGHELQMADQGGIGARLRWRNSGPRGVQARISWMPQ